MNRDIKNLIKDISSYQSDDELMVRKRDHEVCFCYFQEQSPHECITKALGEFYVTRQILPTQIKLFFRLSFPPIHLTKQKLVIIHVVHLNISTNK